MKLSLKEGSFSTKIPSKKAKNRKKVALRQPNK
jgi:hypothetical protein